MLARGGKGPLSAKGASLRLQTKKVLNAFTPIRPPVSATPLITRSLRFRGLSSSAFAFECEQTTGLVAILIISRLIRSSGCNRPEYPFPASGLQETRPPNSAVSSRQDSRHQRNWGDYRRGWRSGAPFRNSWKVAFP